MYIDDILIYLENGLPISSNVTQRMGKISTCIELSFEKCPPILGIVNSKIKEVEKAACFRPDRDIKSEGTQTNVLVIWGLKGSN